MCTKLCALSCVSLVFICAAGPKAISIILVLINIAAILIFLWYFVQELLHNTVPLPGSEPTKAIAVDVDAGSIQLETLRLGSGANKHNGKPPNPNPNPNPNSNPKVGSGANKHNGKLSFHINVEHHEESVTQVERCLP